MALVSSGDAGVHGMAARTLALVRRARASSQRVRREHGESPRAASLARASPSPRPAAHRADAPPLRVEVVPGVTAALAVAARVGAPLADDWATLSLSDLHVPWATVERRLTALAATGIALALYNPRSATRTTPFERALSILRAHREPDTPAIVATDVARPTEAIVTTTLEHLDPETVTMRTLVLVAGESAEWAGEHLIARRGA